jgi:hypothetical protein
MTLLQWDDEIAPHLTAMQPVVGGFSSADRGIVTLSDGTRAFVKLATDEDSQYWTRKEIIVYQTLLKAGYPYMPRLLAVRDDQTAFALEDLSDQDFGPIWHHDKVAAVMKARDELKKRKHLFENNVLFTNDSVVSMHNRWPELADQSILDILNARLQSFGQHGNVSLDEVHRYTTILETWDRQFDTLVHHDIRSDNFAYDETTQTGKLVDWNWLCIGNNEMDITPLCISMIRSDYDVYAQHPDLYSRQAIAYVVGYWLDVILHRPDGSQALRRVQAESVGIGLTLLRERSS